MLCQMMNYTKYFCIFVKTIYFFVLFGRYPWDPQPSDASHLTVWYRAAFYAAGLLVLALGLTLNTKAGLGVSAIISVSYSISLIFNLNFGNVTLGLYTVFVILELILHLIHHNSSLRKQPEALTPSSRASLKFILLADVLQIPLSIAFTRFLNVFSALLPDFPPENTLPLFALRLLTVICAIILTGIGAAASLNMRLIPNPGDGIVQAIALGFLFTGKLQGVGIGTVLAVIGVGRSIAVFNHFAQDRMKKLADIRD